MTKLVSVVVPCRNESRYIAHFLDSLLAQRRDGFDLEIVVADGMSEDGTRDTLAEYAGKHPCIRVVDNVRQVIPCGLNAAIRAAGGDVIVRLDSHAEYPSDYLLKCVQVLERTQAEVVGGRCVNSVLNTPTLMARAAGTITSHPFGVGRSPFRTRKTEGPADSVAFGAFPRKVFERFGLFDERLVRNEDNEMWWRIRRARGCVYFDPSIRVYYYHRTTLRAFLSQAFHNGFWCALSSRLNPLTLRPRHVIPMGFVVYMLLATLLTILGFAMGQWIPLALGLAGFSAYLIPDLIFSISMSRGTERIPGSPLLAPLAFVITPLYHLAYGLGWWRGWWVVFAGRWRSYLGAPVDQTVEYLLPLRKEEMYGYSSGYGG